MSRSRDETLSEQALEAVATDELLVPAGSPQVRYWALQQLAPASMAYHLPGCFSVHGPLQVQLLQQCLHQLAQRHEALRTTLELQGREVMQRIAPSGQWPLIQVAWDPPSLGPEAGSGDDRLEALALQALARAAAQPFDLQRAPLARAYAVRVSEQFWVVAFVLHHALADAVALQVLMGELRTLYEAGRVELRAGEDLPDQAVLSPQEGNLPEVALHYADCSHFAAEWLQSDQAEQQRGYWRKALEELPGRFEFPPHRAVSAPTAAEGGARRSLRVAYDLTPELSTALEVFASQRAATPFMVLLSALYWQMMRHSGREDLCVGAPFQGRVHAGSERVVGCFVNTLALRTQITGSDPFDALLARVRETCLGAQANQQLPFEQVVQAAGVVRQWDQNPLFDVLFGLQSRPEPFEMGGCQWRSRSLSLQQAKFDWSLLAERSAERYHLVCDCDAERYEESGVRRMLQQLVEDLQRGLTNPDRSLRTLGGPMPELATPRTVRPAPSPGPSVPPAKATEQSVPGGAWLRGVWAEVLGVPEQRVTGESGFFGLGGDSVLAMQLVHRARAEGCALRARDVFEHQRFDQMLGRVQQLGLPSNSPSGAVSKPVEEAEPYPLTALQRGLLSQVLQAPNDSLYVQQVRLVLRGNVNVPRLREAWEQTVARHAALRCRMVLGDATRPPQQVVSSAPAPWEGSVLDESWGARAQQALEQLAIADYQAPFDLAVGPLQRMRCSEVVGHGVELCWTHHHLLLDGWSAGRVLADWLALYDGGLATDPSGPPALSHAAFVQWLAEHSAAQSAASAWKPRLPPSSWGPVLASALPGSGATPSRRNGERQWSVDFTERFRRQCARFEVTPNAALLTVWGRSLAAVTGRESSVVGVTVAGRPEDVSGAQSAVGMFLNTLPMALAARFGRDWAEASAQVQADCRWLMEHQWAELPAVARGLGTTGPALFDTLWAFENYPLDAALRADRSDFVIEPPRHRDHSHYALNAVVSVGAHLKLRLNYCGARVAESWCEALLEDFAERLEQFVRAVPAGTTAWEGLGRTGWLRQRSQQWMGTVPSFPYPSALELVLTQCRRQPAALAVEAGPQRLTYAQLERASRRVADALRLRLGLNAAREACVAVCVPRGVSWVVAVLGVVRSGAAYLSLDPSAPRGRLEKILSKAPVDGLLYGASSEGRGDKTPTLGLGISRIDLDELLEDTEFESEQAPPWWEQSEGRHGEQVAYRIYTSGSSGEPKGVGVSHRALSGLVQWHVRQYALTAADRCSQVAGLGFDASVWELWPTLAAGASLQIAPEVVRTDPLQLGRWLSAAQVDVAFVPTALARPLLDGAWQPARRLRALLTGGDKLEALSERAEGLVFNHYGPTECAVVATATRVAPPHLGDETGRAAPAIGRPVGGVKAYVCDAWQQAVPPGLAGELWLGGDHLATDYWGDAALTADRFRPDPFSGVSGARCYRTGDRVVAEPNGTLHFVGRLDRQIQVQGMRLELGEVESALCSLPGVRGAMVGLVDEARPCAEGARSVLAAAVWWEAPDRGQPLPEGEPNPAAPDESTWRRLLAEQLPAAAVPAIVAVVSELPLSANGKWDYRKLPQLVAEADRVERSSGPGATSVAGETPPPLETAEQALLREIWQQVLGVPEVSVHDSFFRLGGDSILTLQMIRAAAAQGLHLTAAEVFEKPTIAELSAGGSLASPQPPRPSPRVAELSGAEYPLGALQMGLYFHAAYGQANAGQYQQQLKIHLRGAVQPQRLQRALRSVLARHEALRTGFVERSDGQVVQQVRSAASLRGQLEAIAWQPLDHGAAAQPLSFHDGEALGDSAWQQGLQALCDRDRLTPFELAAPPLLRLRCVRRPDRSTTLVLTIPHLLLDGWSVALVLKDLNDAYEQLVAGQSVRSDPAPSYAEMLPERQSDDASFWQTHLAECSGRRLLHESGLAVWRTSEKDVQGGEQAVCHEHLSLSADLHQAVQEGARRAGVTVNAICQAGWALVLAQYTGRDEVVYGYTVSGRESGRAGIEQTVGLFINTLPMAVRLRPSQSVPQWLQQLQRISARCAQHSASPLTEIQRLVEAPFQLGPAQPLFDCLYVFENYPAERAAQSLGGAFEVQAVEASHETHYPLTFLVIPEPQLRVKVGYRPQQVPRAVAQGMLQGFAGAVREISSALALSEPTDHASAWSVQALREAWLRQWLLSAPSGLDRGSVDGIGAEGTGSVLNRIAATAASSPERAAVHCGRETLDYGTLHHWVQRVAAQLLDLNLPPEAVVALALPPGLSLVVGALSVLRAGGAFLVVDESIPRAGQVELLRHAAVRALLGGETAEGLAESLGCACISLQVSSSAPLSDGGVELSVSEPGPEALAYVLHTSGSSGQPKPVGVSRASFENFLTWMVAARNLSEQDTVLHKSPLSFDGALWEVFAPLCVGGQCVVATQAERDLPAALWQLLRERRITVAQFVPSLLQAVVAEASGQAPVEHLRLLACGGEAFSAQLASQILQCLPSVQVVQNVYGPTEATVDATAWSATRQQLQEWLERHSPAAAATFGEQSLPLGTAVAGAGAWVLDGRGLPVPDGVMGQLWLSGPGLSRGYLGQPAATADKFRPAPRGCPQQPAGARWYATGDRVYRDAEGQLVFAGRMDRQVKLRGLRVELGAIEAVARQLPEVGNARVCAVAGPSGRQRLVLFVQRQESLSPSDPVSSAETRLRRALQDGLPAGWVPPTVQWVEHWPVTARGKVDELALRQGLAERPAAVETSLAGASCSEPGASAAERAMAAVWAEVLGVPRVLPEDNFFDLGGDSILSLQVCGRARAAGWEVHPVDLFEHQTVRAVVRHTTPPGELLKPSEPPRTERLAPAELSELSEPASIPLTPIAHWLLRSPGVDLNHYNQSVALRLESPPPLGRLQAALDELLLRHDALRLRYDPTAHRQWVVAPASGWPLVLLDSVEADSEQADRQFERACEQAQASLNLTEGPLVRAVLQRRAPGQGDCLLLAVHHWAVDAVSWRLLLAQLAEACLSSRPLGPGDASPLPMAPGAVPGASVTFAQYCRSLHQLATTSGPGQALRHAAREHYSRCSWHEVLPLAQLGEGASERGEVDWVGSIASTHTLRFELSQAATEALLRVVPGVLGVTVQDALLGSLVHALGHGLQAPALCIALEGHGRLSDALGLDVSEVVGWFTAIHPLVVRWHEQFADTLAATRAEWLAVPEGGIGYGLLQLAAAQGEAIEQQIPGHREPEVSFNYLGQLDPTARQTPGVSMIPAPGGARPPSDRRRYAFDISAYVAGKRLAVHWAFNGEAFDPQLVQGWLSMQEQWLQALADEPAAFAPHQTQPPEQDLDSEFDLDSILGELNA